MNIRTEHIGSIVNNDFRTAAIFKQNKIDFCCKGGRTIEEACANNKINPEKIYNAIASLPNKETIEIDFQNFPIDLLTDYIEKTHHRYADEKTPIIQAFLEKLAQVHGDRHPELFQIKDLFFESVVDLKTHFKKEEMVLFPYIRNMVKTNLANNEFTSPAFGTVKNPIAMMKEDHTVEGERFEKIATLTSGYTPPADACNTYRVTYAMLEEFENDLHTHIHIENNILFPKAIQFENTLKLNLI